MSTWSFLSLMFLSLLTLTSASTGNATTRYLKDDAVKSEASSRAESENLRTILNYVRDEQRASSATISLVYLKACSNLPVVDLVSEYVASESVVGYKTTSDQLSRKYAWQSRVDLVWILIVDDVDLLRRFVLEQSHIWKATNRYLIIVTAVVEPPREIFRSVWRSYSVHRIVAVSGHEGFRCLSKYLPFERNRRSEYGVVRKVCPSEERVVELYDEVETLNGYPMRVIVFHSLMINIASEETENATFTGLDAEAMFLLEKKMRASFLVQVIHETCDIDPFHRALQHIDDGDSDMIVTGFFVHDYREYRKFEFTVGIYDDKLCLIAPAARFMPKSYMPILPFSRGVWAILAAYNLVASVLWYLVKYYSVSFRRREPSLLLLPLMAEERRPAAETSRSYEESPPRIHPYVFACFDLAETWCYPLKDDAANGGSTNAQRAFLFGTLFFGLIVTGLYQSCLVSSLSNPFHYPELNTLEAVADSNLSIITKYPNLKENTFTDNTTLAERLKSKMTIVTVDKHTNEVVAFDRNVTALARYSSVKLDNLSIYLDEDGNELLHIVEECPTTYLLSYIVRIYSPYRERINDLLLQMQEAGLVAMWYANMTYTMYADEQRRKMARSDRRIKLTLEHYSLTFVGLSLGLLCCAIVFLVELCFAERCHRKRPEIAK